MRPTTGRIVLLATLVVAFLALTIWVEAGGSTALDVAARDHFRPHDVWGPAQLRADWLVEGLKPRNTFALLAAVAILLALRRRELRTAAWLVGLAGATIVTTLVVKVLTERPDPHHDLSTLGGSFPSGHVIGVLVCLAGCCLAVTGRPRWWCYALPAVVAALMGWALLLQGAHWLTDVLGGALWGTILLVAVSEALPRVGSPAASPRRTAG